MTLGLLDIFLLFGGSPILPAVLHPIKVLRLCIMSCQLIPVKMLANIRILWGGGEGVFAF